MGRMIGLITKESSKPEKKPSRIPAKGKPKK